METKQEQIKEEWRPVVGYEGLYEVSNIGNVDSLNYHRDGIRKALKQTITYRNYKTVILFKRSKAKTCFVHRLVAESFIPNPENLPVINHKDENKLNNCADNLEWCTQKYNINYGTGIKRRVKSTSSPVIQLTLNGDFVSRFDSSMDAERKTGIPHSSILLACKGVKITTSGYRWRYENEEKNEKAIQKREEIEKRTIENRENYARRRMRPVLQYTIDGNFVAEYESCYMAGKKIGICKDCIRNVCLGKRSSFMGFIFKYKE